MNYKPLVPYYRAQWMLAGKRSGTAPPFDPSSIAGLKGWWKADSLALSDGAAVTTVPDSSGSGNTQSVIAGTAPTFKTNIINGKPVIRFDGVNNALSTSVPVVGAQPDTVFFVINASVANFVMHGGPTAPTDQILGLFTGGNIFLNAGTSVQDALNHFGAFHVFTGIFSGGTGTGYVDGSQTCTGAVGTDGIGTIQIMNTGVAFWPGDMAEMLIYNSALSNTDRANVENYLKTKYAIP